MKVGIVTSGVDMLVLFRFLAKYDFSYSIVYDDLGWPWTDKPLEFVLDRAKQSIDYLVKNGCEKIIVPPVIELALHHDKKYASSIMPLWNDYLVDSCLSASAVGKIGFAGEYVDMTNKNLFEDACANYMPNEKQQKRVDEIAQKKSGYSRTMSFWWNEITMWKYYLTKLSFKSQIVHHAMKADWRYFKDAGVDTIIPTSYGFFAYEAILGKFLNTNKQKFHRLSAVEKQFEKHIDGAKTSDYRIEIAYTGTLDHLTREKKWIYMLQRGKEIEISSSKISLS